MPYHQRARDYPFGQGHVPKEGAAQAHAASKHTQNRLLFGGVESPSTIIHALRADDPRREDPGDVYLVFYANRVCRYALFRKSTR